MAIPVIAQASASGPSRALSLEQALLGMTSATTSDEAIDLALRYARGRWVSSLLLGIEAGPRAGIAGTARR